MESGHMKIRVQMHFQQNKIGDILDELQELVVQLHCSPKYPQPW